MIFRDLGSDKIFGHIFNLAENLAETAVKNMFYGDDTFRAKSKPQKKYQSEPICLPDDDIDNIETRIYRMKKLGKGKTSSEAFLAEAEYMKDVTDCYAYTKEPRKYYKENILPDQMTLGELRTYYTWRTKIFNGKYEPAERLYLTLYMTELVLGIHGFTNDGTVEEMIKILNAQDQNAVNDNHIVLQYLMDYIILHETSYSYDKVCSLLEPHFKPMKTEYHKINREHYDAALSTLSLQSSYDFEHSRLMESNYGYLLPQCIDYTFHRMEPYLSSHQVDLFDLLFRDTISKRTLAWYPYSHNPFLHVPFNQQIDVTLPNGTHYERRGGNLYQTAYHLIGKNIFRE
ncbi:MAG: hypothetical protein J6W76_05950, partial [Spirochaetales bacterium]|nr:hypothetical protein [Spirochaetales bacterium]